MPRQSPAKAAKARKGALDDRFHHKGDGEGMKEEEEEDKKKDSSAVSKLTFAEKLHVMIMQVNDL